MYRYWKEKTLATYRNDLAIYPVNGQAALSFGDLQALLDQQPRTREALISSNTGVEFIVDCLQAWRDEVAFCPIEPATSIPSLQGIPPEVAHVKCTSGSTGLGKLVLFTADQLAADARNIVSTMKLRRECPNVAVISMAHSYGFSNLVLPLLLYGIPIILCDSALPGSVASALKEGSSLTLPAVPAMWKAWLEAGILNAPITTAISAGAPLSLHLEHRIFKETGIKVHNFYGSSECGGIAYDRSPTPREDASYVGEPMEGIQLSVDASRLIVTGDTVALGYWPLDPTGNHIRPREFVTTDLAEINDAGHLFLKGRATDAINVAGRKVIPEEIEQLLQEIPSVRHCLIFGVPSRDPERVDEIIAVIHPTFSLEDKEAAKELKKALRGKGSSWKFPRHWWFTTDLLPNTRGKISRAYWRKQFRSQRNAIKLA